MTVGLVVFVLVVLGNNIVLGIDLVRYLNGWTTITWFLRSHHDLAWTAVLVQMVGAVGLACHLRSW